jgi:hypothetical protein
VRRLKPSSRVCLSQPFRPLFGANDGLVSTLASVATYVIGLAIPVWLAESLYNLPLAVRVAGGHALDLSNVLALDRRKKPVEETGREEA